MNVLASGPSISRPAALPVHCVVPASGQVAECSIRSTDAPRVKRLTRAFGVLFPGKIVGRSLGKEDKQLSEAKLRRTTPLQAVKLEEKASVPSGAVRVALHLIDSQGRDRGVVDDAFVPGEKLE